MKKTKNFRRRKVYRYYDEQLDAIERSLRAAEWVVVGLVTFSIVSMLLLSLWFYTRPSIVRELLETSQSER